MKNRQIVVLPCKQSTKSIKKVPPKGEEEKTNTSKIPLKLLSKDEDESERPIKRDFEKKLTRFFLMGETKFNSSPIVQIEIQFF